jgi:hypothetical protein
MPSSTGETQLQEFGDYTVKETTEPELSPEANGDPHVEDVLSALLARAVATVDLTTATVKLAAAETRLAISSAGLLIGFVAVLLVMALVTWLVALATAFTALQALGMSALLALSTLLIVQLGICALLGYTIISLSRNLSFPLTRQAIRSSVNVN